MGIDALWWAERGRAPWGRGDMPQFDRCGRYAAGLRAEIDEDDFREREYSRDRLGGAGNIDHVYDVLTEGKADAALVASITHYGTFSIRQIKEELSRGGVKVRMAW